jgi:flagellar hook-associated protein 3 FlgL
MRVTNSMYYNNVFSPNKNKISNALLDVNKQISSGLKIEYAGDDISVYSDTMRLDNEINTLEQAKDSTSSAMKMATQTDTTLNEFQTTMDRIKVLLVNSANASQNDESLDAIYKELKGLEEHLKNLANTSVNGQYIFSGTALNTKPIDADGNYHGNDGELKAFAGSNVKIQYNIPGSELFLGEESHVQRKITTNVKNLNQTALYPDVMKDPAIPRELGEEKYITSSDTIRDLMGDIDDDPENNPNPYHFYVSGTRHNGESFFKELKLDATQSIDELMDSISELYGRDAVNVSLNEHGQIEIEDRLNGSSKLDFHMVGAVDFDLDGNGADDADGATSLEELENKNITLKGFTRSEFSGRTSNVQSMQDPIDKNNFTIGGELIDRSDFSKAEGATPLSAIYGNGTDYIHFGGTDVNGNGVDVNYSIAGKTVSDLLNDLNANYDDDANNNDYLDFYIKDGKIHFESNDDIATNNISIQLETRASNDVVVDGIPTDSFLSYNKIPFTKKESSLLSNVSQIVKEDNSYATDATKLSEVADLTQGTSGTLDGTTYKLQGIDRNGVKFEITYDLKNEANGGSTFSILQDSNGNGDLSDDVQDPLLQDIPIYNVDGEATPADEVTYRQFMDIANLGLTGTLPQDDDGDGSISADEYYKAVRNADYMGEVSLDSKGRMGFKELNATDTQAEMMIFDTNSPQSLQFQANSSLEIRDPKTDFFEQLDTAIEAVKLNRYRADGDDLENPRNLGIQNGIQIIDDLGLHITKSHSKIGALTNSLNNSMQRSEMLSLSTQSLRSSVIDTDIAEASLKLNQLSLNYQAILATVGKVSQLSLVNYI